LILGADQGTEAAKTATDGIGSDMEKAGADGQAVRDLPEAEHRPGQVRSVGATVTSRLDAMGLGGWPEAGRRPGRGCWRSRCSPQLQVGPGGSDLKRAAHRQSRRFRSQRGRRRLVCEVDGAGWAQREGCRRGDHGHRHVPEGGRLTDASLAKTSTTLTSLAADLSSFSNIPVPEALDGIQAACAGGSIRWSASGCISTPQMWPTKPSPKVCQDDRGVDGWRQGGGHDQPDSGADHDSAERTWRARERRWRSTQRALNAELDNTADRARGARCYPRSSEVTSAGAQLVKVLDGVSGGSGRHALRAELLRSDSGRREPGGG